jgi:phosphate transport system substrate-binding protein
MFALRSGILPSRGSRLLCLSLALVAPKALAQTAFTSFCFNDGSQVKAERFEIHDGKFQLFVPGSAAPLEYSASNVCSINVDPCLCGGQKTLSHAPDVQGGPDRFGIYGSNTIGERMMPMLLETYARKRLGSDPIVKFTKPEESEITLMDGSATKAKIDFQSHGTATALPGLLSGKAQIAMASRQLNKAEAEALRARFNIDAYAPENEHILSLGGYAIIANNRNPVQQLTLDQIARLFSGAIVNWRDVGGPDLPVAIYRLDDKSGTYDLLKEQVLEPSRQTISAGAKQFESSEMLSGGVARDPGAIGFVGLPYRGDNTTIRIASSCGLIGFPNHFSTKTEEYPLSRRLYAYTIGEPASPTARDFMHFTLSEEVGELKTESGYMGMTIEFQDSGEQSARTQAIVQNPEAFLGRNNPVPASAVRFFETAMGEMRRASIEFRFRPGGSDLDARALLDLSRLARYLASPAASGKAFYLVGFADSEGGWERNQALALHRAQVIAGELRKRGGFSVSPDRVKALSYMAPVACNDTEAGRAKNRRVEVWIADK